MSVHQTATKQGRYNGVAWLLGAMVVITGAVAWQQSLNGTQVTAYTLFPLLGIMAWSLMWTHYMYGALRLTFGGFTQNYPYKKVSEYVVLACILLHPGLLVYRLWADTGKLPPGSYEYYVGRSQKLFVTMGAVALTCFLAYEILMRLRRSPRVVRVWPWISLSQMIAMGLIFVHSLELGRHLQRGWFEAYWLMLGLLLVPCFAVVARADWTRAEERDKL